MDSNSIDQTKNGHRERLRIRLEKEPLAMADYEILELLLGLTIKRGDTKPLAKELLVRFGNLRGLMDAKKEELLQVKGFGKSLFSLWSLLHELLARYASAPYVKKQSFTSPETVAEMAIPRMAHLSMEEIWIALLNTRNHLIAWERVGKGSISSISVQCRDILEKALLAKASNIILIHNHPGGNPSPSQADINFTRELQKSASLLGINLLDHLIISSAGYYSFVKANLLPFAGD